MNFNKHNIRVSNSRLQKTKQISLVIIKLTILKFYLKGRKFSLIHEWNIIMLLYKEIITCECILLYWSFSRSQIPNQNNHELTVNVNILFVLGYTNSVQRCLLNQQSTPSRGLGIKHDAKVWTQEGHYLLSNLSDTRIWILN